jgi:drug/metabolite transporter (DMT)-like permease
MSITYSNAVTWLFVVPLGVVVFSAITLGPSGYPGLLLGIGLIASAVFYSSLLKRQGSENRPKKFAWFVAAVLSFATVLAFIRHEIRDNQQGILISYLMLLSAIALATAAAVSYVGRLKSRRRGVSV